MIIRNARNLLNSFATWIAMHVRTNANSVARKVAKEAILYEVDKVELKCIQLCIQYFVVANDIILR